MLNANDIRASNARRNEMERAARKQNAARAAQSAQKAQTNRWSWSRFAALFF